MPTYVPTCLFPQLVKELQQLVGERPTVDQVAELYEDIRAAYPVVAVVDEVLQAEDLPCLRSKHPRARELDFEQACLPMSL